MDPSSKLEERISNRRQRRWRRRARIAAPFFTIPLLIGTLVLAVGIIEYQPKEPREKLTDRPISKANLEYRKSMHSKRPGLSDAAVLTSPATRTERLMETLRPIQENRPPIAVEELPRNEVPSPYDLSTIENR